MPFPGAYWSTYKWCNGTEDGLTKYNTDREYGIVDNKVELDIEDDVAHKKLCGKWRMPTDAEWRALIDQCKWEWTTRNSVTGYLVTASNGNSIFLPAAGNRRGTDLSYAGSNGYYWSSSLNTGYPASAWFVYFDSGLEGRSFFDRYVGRSVRPVSE